MGCRRKLSLGIGAAWVFFAAVAADLAAADAPSDPLQRRAETARSAHPIRTLADLAVAIGESEVDLLELSDVEMTTLLDVEMKGMVGVVGRRKILNELSRRTGERESEHFPEQLRLKAVQEELAAMHARVLALESRSGDHGLPDTSNKADHEAPKQRRLQA